MRARTVRYAALLSSTSATTAQASLSNSWMRVARPAGAAVRALFDVGTRFKDVPVSAGSCDVIYDQAVTASSSRFSDPPRGSVSPKLSFVPSSNLQIDHRYAFVPSRVITFRGHNAHWRSATPSSLRTVLQ